eukprot:COSAG06_NODE_30585_length_536_cov_0.851259_1_plen_39_part_10
MQSGHRRLSHVVNERIVRVAMLSLAAMMTKESVQRVPAS